jgi:Tol biopolymer transport system component
VFAGGRLHNALAIRRVTPVRVFLFFGVGTALVGCGGSTADMSSPLPTRYLVTVVNPTINVNDTHKNPILIEIVDARDRAVRVVERTREGGFGSGDARWSPNGKMIAWTDPNGLNVERSDGSDRRLLVPATCAPDCNGASYAWSPNSRVIALGGAGRLPNHLRIVDVATRAATEIAPVYRSRSYQLIGWSPNGRQLAFALESFSGATGDSEWLVVANADGSHERRLFTVGDPAHDTPVASWSPDSRSIAFTDDGRDPRDPNFAIVNVATGRIRRVGGLTPADDPPVWSPDGRQLTVVRYVAVSRYSVSTFNIATGKLTNVGVGVFPIGWYAANTITTMGGTGNNALVAINATNRTERKLFALPSPFQFSVIDPEP